MPTYKISIKAELENIKSLSPIPNNLWKLNIRSSSGDIREGVTISEGDVIELEGSKGTANFVLRWSKAEQQSYMKIVPLKKVTGLYTDADSGKWIAILGIECRGIEITEYVPGFDFDAETSGGTKFNGIDLTEKEWTEYDEDADLSVSIMEFESRIERV
jgi:hypothetical protein